jgi:ATP-dependent DNA helicase DinG
MTTSVPDSPSQPLPDAPALVVRGRTVTWVSCDGEVGESGVADGARLLRDGPALVVHAGFTARRLGIKPPVRRPDLFDLTDLYAFVRPARPLVPTPKGLARALRLPLPETPAAEAALLFEAARALLAMLADRAYPRREIAARQAQTLRIARWAWAVPVIRALGIEAKHDAVTGGIDVWNRMKPWEEFAPPPPPGHRPVPATAVAERLAALIGDDREARPEQAAYAQAVTEAFAPRAEAGTPRIVLAEAGTGIGKTLGYLAPASLWAEINEGPVWISTYTKALQRQLDQELDRLYPDPARKAARAVIRKGRENYLCLLNFQEITGRAGVAIGGPDAIALTLVARWAEASRDGDMVGGDFPAWLDTGRLGGLTDRRGECVHSACVHYRVCPIESAVRKARRAEIVVANHALVMAQATLGGMAPDDNASGDAETGEGFGRLVFDEGHHLFDAADSAFSARLSGSETHELRRWILGAEQRRDSRGRGLARRLGDLIDDDSAALDAMARARHAASALPADGWLKRLGEANPQGAIEVFLSQVRAHVLAHGADQGSTYGAEAEITATSDALRDAASAADTALAEIGAPLMALARALRAMLDARAGKLETATRARIEAAARGLERRGGIIIPTWRAMLGDLIHERGDAEMVDWMAIDRQFGRDMDVGMLRHHIDPTMPFARTILEQSKGALITSATLRDRAPEDEPAAEAAGWRTAETRTGAAHLPFPVTRASFASPFDYGAATRVLIVNDVRREDTAQVAAAYRELFLAAGGGGLGLFTAIHRLRAVHEHILEPLESADLPLYAQHVDAMDAGTLVDIFRAETNACLLGTDAVRDGVDVPGEALRLIVFDRVPWPRPDILHKARRARFGGRYYDDLVARLRLKQAYGRLIRRAGDRGVFVMLDARTPSRLLTAFPEGAPVARVGLAEAVATVRGFLKDANRSE